MPKNKLPAFEYVDVSSHVADQLFAPDLLPGDLSHRDVFRGQQQRDKVVQVLLEEGLYVAQPAVEAGVGGHVEARVGQQEPVDPVEAAVDVLPQGLELGVLVVRHLQALLQDGGAALCPVLGLVLRIKEKRNMDYVHIELIKRNISLLKLGSFSFLKPHAASVARVTG